MLINETKLLKLLKKDNAVYEKTCSGFVVGNNYGFYHLPELSPRIKGRLIELGFNLDAEKTQMLTKNKTITEYNESMEDHLEIPDDESPVKLTKLIYRDSGKNDDKYLLVTESGEIIAINAELLDPALAQPGELTVGITAQCKDVYGKVHHLRLVSDDHTIGFLLPVLHQKGGWTDEIKNMISAPNTKEITPEKGG